MARESGGVHGARREREAQAFEFAQVAHGYPFEFRPPLTPLPSSSPLRGAARFGRLERFSLGSAQGVEK